MPQALAVSAERGTVAMRGRRTREAEGESSAPMTVVAAIPPRQLARSGDSPCHEFAKASGLPLFGSGRGASGEPRPAVGWAGGRASLPATPGVAPCPSTVDVGQGGAGWRWWPQPSRGPPTGRQPIRGAEPRRPSRRRGKPAQVERSEDRSRQRVQR